MTLVKFLLSVVDAQGVARQTPALPAHYMLERYSRATKRLFLLDYDVSPPSSVFLLNGADSEPYNRRALWHRL